MRYAVFFDRVKGRLEWLTDSTVFSTADGTGRLLSYCPRCLDGIVCARLVDGPEPLVTITFDGRLGCSLGCTEEQIGQVLFA